MCNFERYGRIASTLLILQIVGLLISTTIWPLWKVYKMYYGYTKFKKKMATVVQ